MAKGHPECSGLSTVKALTETFRSILSLQPFGLWAVWERGESRQKLVSSVVIWLSPGSCHFISCVSFACISMGGCLGRTMARKMESGGIPCGRSASPTPSSKGDEAGTKMEPVTFYSLTMFSP